MAAAQLCPDFPDEYAQTTPSDWKTSLLPPVPATIGSRVHIEETTNPDALENHSAANREFASSCPDSNESPAGTQVEARPLARNFWLCDCDPSH
jgi:hypothetical protein